MKEKLTLGVVGKSLKEGENRVPIHPDHISRIPIKIRRNITFEIGYGEKFGMDDSVIAQLTSGRVATRNEILNDFDCVLLPKPIVSDLANIKEGTIVWGWPHCVQQQDVTQIAIDRKLTLIAWEEMFTWTNSGDKDMHVFYKNNEIAGYAGVNHAISLAGVIGNYGKPAKVAVISFGSVSRGAIYALKGQGFNNITVFTFRPVRDVRDQLPGVCYKQIIKNITGEIVILDVNGNTYPLIDDIKDFQIIVNGTLQNIDNPMMFVSELDSKKIMNGAIIIDISCDENMGFWCAKPTTFKNPIFEDNGAYYYSVDHTPSYYWNSASWEISEAILPFIPIVMEGKDEWSNNKTIAEAIEINEGKIVNKKIFSFQNRSKEYPHNII